MQVVDVMLNYLKMGRFSREEFEVIDKGNTTLVRFSHG